jgi:hypothetical protein
VSNATLDVFMYSIVCVIEILLVSILKVASISILFWLEAEKQKSRYNKKEAKFKFN